MESRSIRVQLCYGMEWRWLLEVSGKSPHIEFLHDLYSNLSLLNLHFSLAQYIGSFRKEQIDDFRLI